MSNARNAYDIKMAELERKVIELQTVKDNKQISLPQKAGNPDSLSEEIERKNKEYLESL